MADKISNSNYDIIKWKSDNPLHPQQMNEQSVDWIFLVDSLNFSFWPDTGREFTIKGEVGYWALCAAINSALRESIPVCDPNYYAKLTYKQAEHIFRTDQTGVVIPMLQERIEILNQNGQILLEVRILSEFIIKKKNSFTKFIIINIKKKFDGTFVNCIKEANSNCITLLKLIYNHFPSFRDECVYKGHQGTFR